MAALNSKVKKAVIPVAGLGTRMLPATKAIPKEMLPLVDKPLIQYVVNECIAAGITEIVLVTHSSKNSIENHFDTSFELEAMLEKRVKRQLLEEVQSICPPHVTIMQVRQGLAKGLGHAVLCAHPVVGDEPVAVILPDVILDEYESDLSRDNLAEMIHRFDETGSSQIMVEPVEDVTAYGVIDCICQLNFITRSRRGFSQQRPDIGTKDITTHNGQIRRRYISFWFFNHANHRYAFTRR